MTYSSGIPPETIPLNAAFKKTYYQMWPESNGPEPKPKIKQGQGAFDDPDWLAWKDKNENRKNVVESILLEAIRQGRITVFVVEDGTWSQILPPKFEEPDCYWPERIFLPGELHSFSGDALCEYDRATPFVKDLDFDNFLESEPLLPPKMNKTGSSGRPSIMKAVLAELERRIEAGELSAGLTPQARDLEDWVGKTFPRYQRPKAASIRNSIRKRFRAATQ